MHTVDFLYSCLGIHRDEARVSLNCSACLESFRVERGAHTPYITWRVCHFGWSSVIEVLEVQVIRNSLYFIYLIFI